MAFKCMSKRAAHGRSASRRNPGSIGAFWPPSFDRRNSRVKGFYNKILDNSRDLQSVLNEVKDAKRSSGAQRASVRLITHPSLIREMNGNGQAVEALIPLNYGLDGYVLIYTGWNNEERRSSREILGSEIESAADIMANIGPTTREDVLRRLEKRGLRTERLENAGEDEVNMIVGIYSEAYQMYPFPLDYENVLGMTNNEDNMTFVGRNRRDEIVSVLFAEGARLDINGAAFRMYELSDYATLRAYRGNGLMTGLQLEVMNAIMEQNNVQLIYAEDRASWRAVNISSRRAGMVYAGTLEKHCLLMSDRDIGEKGEFENLHVWRAPHGQ